jgi:hypothetical protein
MLIEVKGVLFRSLGWHSVEECSWKDQWAGSTSGLAA